VCGGSTFSHHDVLWGDLIAQWGLSSREVDYINVQQGTACTGCGSNVRSIALADALLRWTRATTTLQEWVHTPVARRCDVLEINEAGSLTGTLSTLPGHRLVRYPEYDMMAPRLHQQPECSLGLALTETEYAASRLSGLLV